MISASSVLVVVIGFSSELPDLLFLAGGFVFCFVFMFLYGWVGGGGRERSELKKRQRRRLLIEEEASIATESKPNLSFSLCLLGSIKYIPSGTTLLSLSQEGVGVLPALLRF